MNNAIIRYLNTWTCTYSTPPGMSSHNGVMKLQVWEMTSAENISGPAAGPVDSLAPSHDTMNMAMKMPICGFKTVLLKTLTEN